MVTPYLGFISAAEIGFFPGINSALKKKNYSFSYFSGVFDYNLHNNKNSFVVIKVSLKVLRIYLIKQI